MHAKKLKRMEIFQLLLTYAKENNIHLSIIDVYGMVNVH